MYLNQCVCTLGLRLETSLEYANDTPLISTIGTVQNGQLALVIRDIYI